MKFLTCFCRDVFTAMWTLIRQQGNTAAAIRALLTFLFSHSSIGLLVNFLNLSIKIEVNLIAVKTHLLSLIQNHLALLVCKHTIC